MKIVIVTRSRNEELYAMASEFWPEHIERVKIQGMNNYKDALWYLVEALQIEADYIINCDEDCFIFDWSEVEDIITKMETEGIDYCGMPDSLEWCNHRNNARQVMNPFFNIFDAKRCKWVLGNMTQKELLSSPSVCRFDEPFNGLLYTFSKKLEALELKTVTHEDQITSILPFALHTWYSREFEGEHRQRILDRYEEAKYLRSLPR